MSVFLLLFLGSSQQSSEQSVEVEEGEVVAEAGSMLASTVALKDLLA